MLIQRAKTAAVYVGTRLLVILIVALPASAASSASLALHPAPSTTNTGTKNYCSSESIVTLEAMDEPSITNDTTHLTLSSSDELTHTLYLPIIMKCYGLCGACESNGQGDTEVITTTSSSCLATKIRIDLRTRATGYGFSLFEVEAYGPDDPAMTNNLLVGGTACASSTEKNLPLYYGPHLAIDGSMSTRWASDWHEPEWLVVVLPEPKPVKYVVLKWEDAYATEYQVNVISSGTGCP